MCESKLGKVPPGQNSRRSGNREREVNARNGASIEDRRESLPSESIVDPRKKVNSGREMHKRGESLSSQTMYV